MSSRLARVEESIPTWSQQSWATLALPELAKTYQFMQHPIYRQIFIFTSRIVVKREILVLKPSQYDGCYHVTMDLVLQMAILVEKHDVIMVLVLQMASIAGKILRNQL